MVISQPSASFRHKALREHELQRNVLRLHLLPTALLEKPHREHEHDEQDESLDHRVRVHA